MIRYFFSQLCIFCFTISAFAQADSTKLFYATKFNSDAFVELGSRIIQSNDGAAMDIDFSVNWLVNHQYYLGAAYGQLASVENRFSQIKAPILPPFIQNYNTNIKYQTAGLRFGYLFFEKQKIISLSPDLTIGWAGVKLQTEDEITKLNAAYAAPALKGVFNVSPYFRLGLAINYNVFVFKKYNGNENDASLYNTQLTPKNLSGVGGGVFLRIGSF